MKRKPRHVPLLLLVTTLVLVAGFVLLAINSSKRARLRETLIAIEEQEDDLDALQAALLDAETIMLDHLLSTEKGRLEEYHRAKQRCMTRLEGLRTYESDPLTGAAVKQLVHVLRTEFVVQEQLLLSRHGEKIRYDEHNVREALDAMRLPLAETADQVKDELRNAARLDELLIFVAAFIALTLLLLNYIHQKRLSQSETKVALLEQEQRFSAMMEYGSDVFCLLDDKGNILFISPAVKNVLGYAPGEMNGNIMEYVFPGELEAARGDLMQAVSSTVRAIHRLRHSDGEYRWIEGIARNLLDKSGINTIILNMRDVSETVAARKLLSQSEQKHRLLTENLRDVITTHDREGKYTYASPSMKEILGYEPDSVTGLSPLEFVHEQDHDRLLKIYKLIIDGRASGRVEFRTRHKQGHYVWVETLTRPLRDRDGKVTGFQSSTRDISEQKMLEDELRFQAMLLAEMNESVIAIDTQGRVIYWNDGSQRLFGYTRREMLGKKTDFLYAEGPGAQLTEHAATEVQIRRKNGELLWLETRVTMLHDAEGDMICSVSVGADISDRKKAEEQVQHAQRELEHFAYVASHDLQEPLRMISGFLQLLVKRYGDKFDPQGHEYIGFAVDGAGRMHQLIQNLLEYSRTGRSGEALQAVDMNKVLENVRLNLHASLSESRAVLRAGALPVVHGYASELERLLQNLVENAVKYKAPDDHPRVEISWSEHSDAWQFSVRDNGTGVPPEQAQRIFEPFTRIHGSGKRGSGIGLATCAKIARRHRGRIWVDPAPGGGSVFSFTIDKKMTNVLSADTSLQTETHSKETQGR